MGQIEVYPQKNGAWRVRRRGEGDKAQNIGESVEARREAVDAALEAREHGEAVVLLRPDGSVYGELHHAESDGGQQDVSIEPATEDGEAS